MPADASRARSTAREAFKFFSVIATSGCALPKTRRTIGDTSSSVDTASRRSASAVPLSKKSARAYEHYTAGLEDGRTHLIVNVTSAKDAAERVLRPAAASPRRPMGSCPAEAFFYLSSSAIAAGPVRFCVALDSRTRHLRASCLVRRTP